jgi:ParB family chromosome partitioning protein
MYGSQRALAKRLHRSQGWISQRLALLNLAPEIQARIGEEPIDLLRAVGNRPIEQQAAALEALKAERAYKEANNRATKPPTPQGTSDTGNQGSGGEAPSDYDVITDSANQPPATDRAVADPGRDREARKNAGTSVPGLSPAPEEAATKASPTANASDEATPSVPAQAIAETEADATNQQLKRFPYADGVSAAHLLIHKMSPDEFNKMLDLLIKHGQSQTTTAR